MDRTANVTYDDVWDAVDRIRGDTRSVLVGPADSGALRAGGTDPTTVWLALEFMQHTGSFKARGAANFLAAQLEDGTLPAVGVTIASGGNAGLACAWAAERNGVPATVFLPETAPAVKVAKLADFGAQVRQVGDTYAEAAAACDEFVAGSGALQSHAYDNRYIAAGAGTLLEEIYARLPEVDTVVVAVGGGGLYAGIATAAAHYGVRVVAAEPPTCRAFHAALAAGEPVPVSVDSVAADSLGARTATPMALAAAAASDTRSVLVSDSDIGAARQGLWDRQRLAVEHSAATALAALATGAYRPEAGEVVCVVLCGANTDPSDL